MARLQAKCVIRPTGCEGWQGVTALFGQELKPVASIDNLVGSDKF